MPLLEVHNYWEHPERPVVAEWWLDREKGELPEGLFPPHTIIVTADGVPVCSLAMYLTIGKGVAFLEWPITKPGLGLSAREPMRFAVRSLIDVARELDYGIIRIATLPKIARFLEREGWEKEGETRIPMIFKT